jgi:hypothetical protein
MTPETRLGRLTLQLEPMLGCFGVAPAGGEAISTATSGPHGGNMDYRRFGPGVTAFFSGLRPRRALLRGPQDEYELDALAANTLPGQCVEYDVGNVFDPAYTMVCKVPRRLLQAVARKAGPDC